MRRVLVLRPEPAASVTVERARRRGLEAASVPLFRIEAIAWTPPDAARFDGLLLTSANALHIGGDGIDRLRALPVYAVGAATAQAARDAGFDLAATGDSGVDRLLESIEPRLRLLHLCGEDRRNASQPRQKITHVPVYRARPVADPDLRGARGSVALVHSPRAGGRFAELVDERASIAIAAISAAASDAAGNGWEAIEAASEPTDEALLALAARLCNKLVPE